MNKETILINALNTFGSDAQLMMAIEEMAELTKAIAKYWRNGNTVINGSSAMDNLLEELADVRIMMDQLALMFNKGPGTKYDLEAVETKKLQRLEKLIAEMLEALR